VHPVKSSLANRVKSGRGNRQEATKQATGETGRYLWRSVVTPGERGSK